MDASGLSDLLPSSVDFVVSKENKRGKMQTRRFRIDGCGISNTHAGKVKWSYPKEKILSLGVSDTQPSTVNLNVIHTYTLHCQSDAEANEMVRTCGNFNMGRTPEVLREVERARQQTEAAAREAATVADECARLESELLSLRRGRMEQSRSTMRRGRNGDIFEAEEDADDMDESRDGSSSAGTSDVVGDDESDSDSYDTALRAHVMQQQQIATMEREPAPETLFSSDPNAALHIPASLLPQRPFGSIDQHAPSHRISPPPRSPQSPDAGTIHRRPPPPPPEALSPLPLLSPAPPPFLESLAAVSPS